MDSKNYFKEVSDLIESGYTVGEALDELEIDSRKFYKTITKEQRIILSQIRTVNSIYGTPDESISRKDTKDLHDFFTSHEYSF